MTPADPQPARALASPTDSAWAPLARSDFRVLWAAALVSNIGLAVHDLAAGWMMTGLDPSPLMVALVPAAGVLPLLLFSLPAGALADLVDRRRLLLATALSRLVLTAALALLAWHGAAGPWTLLAMTFLLGGGAALTNPAWQTAMVGLVPRPELHAATALNSLSLNLSRAVGPAIGGLTVAWWGVPGAFALNAGCFAVMALALWRWAGPAAATRDASHATPTARAVRRAMADGLAWVVASSPMRAVLARTVLFVVGSSALWALLPLIAREHLALPAQGYGLLLTCLGVGAVAAALALPAARRRAGPSALVAIATLLMAGALALLAIGPLAPEPPESAGLRWNLAGPFGAMFLAGAAWITVVTCVNSAAQLLAPDALRARAFSCYLAAFFGALAGGSWFWGLVAARVGLSGTLLMAAGALVVSVAAGARWPILRAGA